MAEWLKAADCKSARASVRWFESSPVHQPVFVFVGDRHEPPKSPLFCGSFDELATQRSRATAMLRLFAQFFSAGVLACRQLGSVWALCNGRRSPSVGEQKFFLLGPAQRDRAQPEEASCIQRGRLFTGEDSLSDLRREKSKA